MSYHVFLCFQDFISIFVINHNLALVTRRSFCCVFQFSAFFLSVFKILFFKCVFFFVFLYITLILVEIRFRLNSSISICYRISDLLFNFNSTKYKGLLQSIFYSFLRKIRKYVFLNKSGFKFYYQ